MAPPTHRLAIFKRVNTEEWSNDYLINVANMGAGATLAASLVDFERRIHNNNVTFMYYILSTTTVADRVFRHTAINQAGLLVSAAGTFLPLFNTLRMDMATTDSDPCRKYYRMPIAEDNQTDGLLTGTFVNVIMGIINTYFAPIIATGAIVSGAGNPVTAANVSPVVQMRQLHRRKRPKVT